MSQQPEQEPLLAPEAQQTQQTMDTTPDATEQPPQDPWADIPEEIMACSTDEIMSRIRLIENDIKVCERNALSAGSELI